jgi:hypothetical protein
LEAADSSATLISTSHSLTSQETLISILNTLRASNDTKEKNVLCHQVEDEAAFNIMQ